MSLFKRNAKVAPAKEYAFELSSGFRGYKKFHITVYGNAEAENNNELLKDADLKHKPIVFRESQADNGKLFLQVRIDGMLVGSIFDDTQIKDMASGRITAVYAKVEPETVAGGGEIITKQRARLFVQYTG